MLKSFIYTHLAIQIWILWFIMTTSCNIYIDKRILWSITKLLQSSETTNFQRNVKICRGVHDLIMSYLDDYKILSDYRLHDSSDFAT